VGEWFDVIEGSEQLAAGAGVRSGACERDNAATVVGTYVDNAPRMASDANDVSSVKNLHPRLPRRIAAIARLTP